MSVVVERTAVAISLEVTRCRDAGCTEFAGKLYDTLGSGAYRLCSVLPIPSSPPVPYSMEEWRGAHRTARKRADRSERLGYRFAEIERHEYVDDVYEINVSAPERQGRPMSAGYLERPSESPLPEYPCSRHGIRQNGVLDMRGKLVAYLWMYRAGDLALVSSILGHAEHLRNDVMYLLFAGALEREIREGGFVVYNRHDSGTEGLRYFKSKLGFEAMSVDWELA